MATAHSGSATTRNPRSSDSALEKRRPPWQGAAPVSSAQLTQSGVGYGRPVAGRERTRCPPRTWAVPCACRVGVQRLLLEAKASNNGDRLARDVSRPLMSNSMVTVSARVLGQARPVQAKTALILGRPPSAALRCGAMFSRSSRPDIRAIHGSSGGVRVAATPVRQPARWALYRTTSRDRSPAASPAA